MVNVDGVIFGNYRTGSAGRDLNRKFREPCKSLYPGVVAMKQLISELHTLYGE
jgi:murein tripeptide amidase MpaA